MGAEVRPSQREARPPVPVQSAVAASNESSYRLNSPFWTFPLLRRYLMVQPTNKPIDRIQISPSRPST